MFQSFQQIHNSDEYLLHEQVLNLFLVSYINLKKISEQQKQSPMNNVQQTKAIPLVQVIPSQLNPQFKTQQPRYISQQQIPILGPQILQQNIRPSSGQQQMQQQQFILPPQQRYISQQQQIPNQGHQILKQNIRPSSGQQQMQQQQFIQPPQQRYISQQGQKPNQGPQILQQNIRPSSGQQQMQQQQFIQPPQQKEYNQNFDDDEEVDKDLNESSQKMLLENAKYNLETDLELNVKSRSKCLQLNALKDQVIPVMVSLKTKDLTGDSEVSKPGVDLICVIDKSGSMSGTEMELVKQTLELLLEFLSPKDRLCLIQFNDEAQRLTPLLRVTKKNQQRFKTIIKEIDTNGCTNIEYGMDLAFQQIKQRRYKNPVTSIFLLSDGQDSKAGVSSNLAKHKIVDNFTINSFGFGSDHDPQLMTAISKIKDGNFYFIQKLDTVDECFVDALGGLISVVAEKITLKVSCEPLYPLDTVSIYSHYGEDWKTDGSHYYLTKQYMMSGISKDFIFEIMLPKSTLKVDDSQRNIQILKVQMSAYDIQTKKIVNKSQVLSVTVYNKDERLPQQEEDEDVMLNYFRIIGAQSIDDARVACEQGKNQEAEEKLEKLIQNLKSKKYSNKAQNLLNDLGQAKEVCKAELFQEYGKQQMYQMQNCHQQQVSQPQQYSATGAYAQQQAYQQQMQAPQDQQNFKAMYGNARQGAMLMQVQQKKQQSK